MSGDKQLYELFQAEATEYLEQMNQLLLQLETATDSQPDALRELFRVAHSLKGAARTVNQRDIEQVAHALENIFAEVREGKLNLNPAMADVLYDGLDSIQLLMTGDTEQLNLVGVIANLQALVPNQQAPSASMIESASQPHAVPEAPIRTTSEYPPEEIIRVPVAKLDALLLEVSSLLVSRMNIEQRVSDLKHLREQHHQWQKQWRRVHTDYIRLLRAVGTDSNWQPMLDFLQETQRYMRLTSRQLSATEQALNEDTLILGLAVDALQSGVRQIRLLPFETMVGNLQRMVRDLARELGKDVLFQTVGTRIALDKYVLERIRDPLLHLLRNAIDHGIETPDVRETKGKPRQGLILLTLMQKGNKVHILVSDDGRGIDGRYVRQVAIERGFITAHDVLNEAETLELLLQPGMTTTEQVSTISGRGVGLDVVRQKIEQLQGHLRIESAVGHGTTFELELPISLSTLRCMLIQVGQELYAIPTNAVVRVLDYEPDVIFTVKGKSMLAVDGRPVPLVYLADALERSEQTNQGTLVMILSALERQHGFIVDDIISEQEVIVRNLNPELARIRNVSGATLLANGQVVIILNVSDLIKSAQGRPIRQREVVPPTAPPPVRRRILVVDDSITTRTLQKNILEAAGYEVLTATHGAEALELLTSQGVDLVISDIEMPWINGFELTARIRKHPNIKNLPIILVTSLDAPEHREQGFKAGADAYIAKGVFDQNELLHTIQTLL